MSEQRELNPSEYFEIVKMGITTFIYRDDIEEYIDNIAKDTVKIIELEKYEREIPDEIVAIIEKGIIASHITIILFLFLLYVRIQLKNSSLVIE